MHFWLKCTVFVVSLLFDMISLADTLKQSHGEICSMNQKSKDCMDAKTWVRINHPDLLIHERDNTMRLGIRARKDTKTKPLYGSLRACVSCHVKKDRTTDQYPKISSQKHFCTGCHQQLAVKLDCFECHTSKPDTETLIRLSLIKEAIKRIDTKVKKEIKDDE